MKRLYLDKHAEVFALIDDEDYTWALQWNWGYVLDRHGVKKYASRPTRVKGKPCRIYLHKAVLERMGVTPPSKKHTIGDHIDGDSLNCTRGNLRYATASMNRRNVFGSYKKQIEMQGTDDVPF